MSVAIRAITRIQDGDDAPALGAGQDGYALTWNNATGAFVATAMPAAGVTDHGALTGLTPDDDHTQYALLAGRAGGQTLYGGTAANDDITIHGTSNATRTTSYVLLQPTAGNVGIGTSAPSVKLHATGTDGTSAAFMYERRSEDIYGPYHYYAKSRLGGGSSVTNDFSGGPMWQLRTGGAYQTYAAIWGIVENQASTLGGISFLTSSDGNLPGVANERMRITSAGGVGIGTTAPATLLHPRLESAATNAVTNIVTIGHDTTGTAAAGFGAGLLFALESSTTAAQDAARVQALWYEATHATRKADLVGTAYDTAEREGWRVRGNGSAAAIGFLGATPIARKLHVADPAGGATVDAEARAAINAILVSLEDFGFHATS